MHETVERRRREAIAFAAGQIARRHERRCFGCGNAHDQEHHGDHAQPAHWRFRLRGGANAHHSPPRSWPSSDQRLNVCLHAWLPTAATGQEPKQPPIRPGFNSDGRLLWLNEGKLVRATPPILLEIIAKHAAIKHLVNHGTEGEPNWAVKYIPLVPDQKTLRSFFTTEKRQGSLIARVTKV